MIPHILVLQAANLRSTNAAKEVTPMIEMTTSGRGSVSERLNVRTDEWVQKQTSVLAPNINHHDTVLECGCGDGQVLESLPGRSKSGVEASPTAARLAVGRGLDVRPTIGDLSETQFSRIVYSVSLEATSNPAESLASVRSLLTDDGLLLISQPVNRDTHRPGFLRAQSEMPSHFAQLLINAGFEPREVAFQRRTYRSAGFRFTSGDAAKQTNDQKTFWIVTPFMALIVIASVAR
jgi:SAM-dependent methyltransferase